MPRKKEEVRVGVFDFETDPFLYGRIPSPFVAGFYDGERFAYFWGADCVPRLLRHMASLPGRWIFYAHNGGKFDFFFFLTELSNPIRIINGRIVSAGLGNHEVRDSYAILPIPLAAYSKDDIDYKKMEPEAREENKGEILSYLKKDCTSLFSLVSKFIERFGVRLTVGGTAIKELEKFHPFDRQGKSHDERFRPYYFGGRVECFERGIMRGHFKVYDTNSMYPHVMSAYDHPTGGNTIKLDGPICDKNGDLAGVPKGSVYFAHVQCSQKGAFPFRPDKAGETLRFDKRGGDFLVSSHELRAALELGLLKNLKVKSAFVFLETIRFDKFVEVFGAEKVAAKKSGDKVSEIFAKLLLNSAYGKFASNPENYHDYKVFQPDELPDAGDGWQLFHVEHGAPSVWRRPAKSTRGFYDVATAASITGAARSVLLRGIHAAKRPIYCDTDSLICEDFTGPIDAATIGAWKLECEGDALAVHGKKMYALTQNGEAVKVASKGVKFSADEIFRLCRGENVTSRRDAPNFSLSRGVGFTERTIRGNI